MVSSILCGKSQYIAQYPDVTSVLLGDGSVTLLLFILFNSYPHALSDTAVHNQQDWLQEAIK